MTFVLNFRFFCLRVSTLLLSFGFSLPPPFSACANLPLIPSRSRYPPFPSSPFRFSPSLSSILSHCCVAQSCNDPPLRSRRYPGPIPAEFGLLSNLAKLYLWGNNLSGQKNTPANNTIRVKTPSNLWQNLWFVVSLFIRSAFGPLGVGIAFPSGVEKLQARKLTLLGWRTAGTRK